jgi:hypothetical protein
MSFEKTEKDAVAGARFPASGAAAKKRQRASLGGDEGVAMKIAFLGRAAQVSIEDHGNPDTFRAIPKRCVTFASRHELL